MKKLINGQNYFRKMLIMCLLVISVTIFILTFFFYQKYTDALSKKLYADQEKNLEKSAQTMNDIYSEVFQLYNTVMLDSKVITFSSLTSFNPAENYATYLIVKKIYNINPYVNSLYIYNDEAKDAITCGSYRFDLDYSWNYLKSTKAAAIFPSVLTGSDKKSLTFAFPVYADNYDELSGGIFINLDMEKLLGHVLGTGPEAGLIIDSKGVILMADSSQIFTLDQSIYASIQNFLNQTISLSGSFLQKINGKQYLCAYYKDPIQELTFLCSTPYSEIVLPMKKQRNLVLVVACLIFFAGIAMQYIITKRLYRPLEQITEELRDSKYAENPDMDEFSLIRHVYENALNEIQLLEQENAVYQPRVKAELLKNLILGNRDITKIQEEFKKNSWNIPFEGMFLCCCLIEKCSENELLAPVIQTRIQQLLYEKLGRLFYVECVTIDSDQVVCLLNTVKDSPITFDELVGLLETIRDELLNSYQITLTMALDGLIRNIEDCRRVYRRVMELIQYRFVLGYNQVIYQKKVMELMPECMSYPDKLADEIMNCMIHGSQQEFLDETHEFFVILKQYAYQPAALLYNRLYLDLLFHMYKLSTPDKGDYLIQETFQFPKTLEDGCNFLLIIYSQYQERKCAVEQLKDNKHFERIEESRNFIEKHFDDCNLSAGMVADYLGYSTNYFSRIFKSITGFYINDYIRQIRIVKAQQLLIESDMTITNIANATGFTNPNYFYSIFKKETGLTPAAYRNAGQII